MADEAASTSRRPRETNSRRVRAALIAVLVVLLLMLLALGYAIVKIVAPSAPAQAGGEQGVGGMQWVRSIYAYGSSDEQRMDSPVSVAIDDAGTIYAVDTQTNMVMAFNPDGSVREAVDLLQLSGTTMPHLGPKSIALGDDGQVYVGAYMGQAIYILDRDLALVDGFEIGTRPYSIVEDGDTLLVSTSEGIMRYTTDGELVGTFAPRGRGDGEVDLPQAMTLTEDGVLYVADSMNGRVDAFDHEGGFLWRTGFGSALQQGAIPSGEASNTSEFQVPTGIAVDANGRLIVSDMQLMEFFVLDAEDGGVLGRYGEFGYEDGQVMYPMGLAYDEGRDWFVSADMGNSRLQILRFPDSAPSSVLAAARRSLVGPVWICCLPPLLLLLLLGLATLRRRRRDDEEGESGDPQDQR